MLTSSSTEFTSSSKYFHGVSSANVTYTIKSSLHIATMLQHNALVCSAVYGSIYIVYILFVVVNQNVFFIWIRYINWKCKVLRQCQNTEYADRVVYSVEFYFLSKQRNCQSPIVKYNT